MPASLNASALKEWKVNRKWELACKPRDPLPPSRLHILEVPQYPPKAAPPAGGQQFKDTDI